ncbi:MAG TPA: cupin domain-containing protein [Acidimicrobiales bacterium]|nr:cupin domain-containing protein [Acidimicrobiales bacterium]
MHRRTGSFGDVLSLGDVDRALTGGGLRRPAFRVVRDGEVLPPSSYTRTARTGAARVDDLIDPGRVLDLFAHGATIVLQGLQRWWPPAATFCRDLEIALGHAVQANAYLTPPGAAGLAPHHDTHDVFVLQVAGTKHWVVRAPVVDAPLPSHTSDHEAAAAQPLLFDTDLEPGDTLYLPRGFVHAAAAQEGLSLHLTIGILVSTVHDVLRELVAVAGDDPAFRRSLPPGWPFDDARATEAVRAAVADLVGWLAGLDPAAVAGRLRDRFVANRTPLLDGQLLEIAGLGAISDDTRVQRRAGSIGDLALGRAGPPAGPGQPATPRLVLTLGDRRVVMPAALEPAVRLLTDGGTHRVGDLGDLLDGPSRLVLARRLVREGAVRTCPPAAGGGPDG